MILDEILDKADWDWDGQVTDATEQKNKAKKAIREAIESKRAEGNTRDVELWNSCLDTVLKELGIENSQGAK